MRQNKSLLSHPEVATLMEDQEIETKDLTTTLHYSSHPQQESGGTLYPRLTSLHDPVSDGTLGSSKDASERSSLGLKIGGSDEDLDDNGDPNRETHVVPPDGGWGWVVVGASFMCNVMVDGIIFTCGMLLPAIKEEFDVSNAQVAWVSSLLGGFYLLAGPFVSSLANAYGFRTVCTIGAVVGAVACAMSYLATGIFFLYFSYGILAGIGFGFIYVPAVIATGFYFEKRRALATGIAVCGSGIGTFTLSPLINFVLSTSWGWRGVLLVNAGLIFTCAIYGLAFRPLNATTGKLVPRENDTPLLIRIKLARDAQLKACMSDVSLQSQHKDKPPMNPNVARLMGEEGGTVKGRSESEAGLEGTVRGVAPHRSATATSLRLDTNKNETLEQLPPPSKHYLVAPTPISRGCTRNESAPSLSLSKTSYRISEMYRRSSRVSLKSDGARPFYRDDIFYSGSMARLPQYTSSESVEQYHASVTQIPPETIEEENEETDSSSCCGSCPTASKAVLTKMFDFTLCTSPTFIVLSFAGFLSLLSLFVPFNFLPMFINTQRKKLGLTEEEAEQTKTFLMSLIGICNTVGRVICGWVSDHPKIDAIMVNNIGLFVGGVATCLIPFINNVSVLYIYGITFGFSLAIFASLRSILLVELLGLEKLTNAFGLLLLIQGFAACFGTPIAGGFADATGDFNVSFYVFGAAYAISGLMCIPIRKLKQWESDRNEMRKCITTA